MPWTRAYRPRVSAATRLSLRDSLLDHRGELAVVVRLVDDGVGEEAVRLEEAAGEDHFLPPAESLEKPQPVVAAEELHAVVGDDDVDVVVEQLLDGAHALGSHEDLVPLAPQVVPQAEPDAVLVLYDQDRRARHLPTYAL